MWIMHEREDFRVLGAYRLLACLLEITSTGPVREKQMG